ncbi:MAG: hypothetical protein ABIO85_05450 [Sphingomicrobium sp.]
MASGTALDANATALFGGVYQNAVASSGGDALASIDNHLGASFSIAASATATASGSANASARVRTGVSQLASASGSGDAAVSLVNDGSFSVDANAAALGGPVANAYADLTSGVYQFADASGTGAASAALANAGTLSLQSTATAQAVGVTTGTGTAPGNALASASLYYGVSQIADGASGASVGLDNSGSLAIGASASATANQDATARAQVDYGIYQDATASAGDASVALANPATLGESGIATRRSACLRPAPRRDAADHLAHSVQARQLCPRRAGRADDHRRRPRKPRRGCRARPAAPRNRPL